MGFKQESLSVAYFKPDLERFVASESLKKSIKDILNGARSIKHKAMHVLDTMLCVYGPATASNPLGYCHVRKSLEYSNRDPRHLVCTGKDCRGFAAKDQLVNVYSH